MLIRKRILQHTCGHDAEQWSLHVLGHHENIVGLVVVAMIEGRSVGWGIGEGGRGCGGGGGGGGGHGGGQGGGHVDGHLAGIWGGG